MAGVLALSQWPRKLKNWDVPPPGYEHLTAQAAKMSGLFPLASHSVRIAPVISDTGFGGLAQSNPAAQQANAAKQAKRVYVTNLPYGISDGALGDFFNERMRRLMKNIDGSAVINVNIREGKDFAFVEVYPSFLIFSFVLQRKLNLLCLSMAMKSKECQ
jgi:splicing factor U2AF 65 kDa subunit